MERTEKTGLRGCISRVLPWLWLTAGYLLDLWFLIVPGGWIVDSDLASDTLLAYLLNQEGGLFSTIWYYSTELHVFNMEWFYRPGLLLFPNDWHLARAFGMALALAIYAVAAQVLAHCAGLGRAGQWAAATLLWPFGWRWLLYSLYGGHYLPHTFFYMVMLAMLLHGKDAPRRKYLAWLAGTCVVALLGGLNGAKQPMFFHAPFLCATALLLVLALHQCGQTDWRGALTACRAQVRLLLDAVVTAGFSAAGYLVYSRVFSKMADFKSYNNITWHHDFDWFMPDDVLEDFFHEFGYRSGVGVLHFSGIASGIGLLMGLFMAFCIVRLLVRYRRLTVNEQLLVLLLVAMLTISTISFVYFQEYYQYFWLMLMPVALLVMATEIKTEGFRLPGTRQLAAACLVCAFTVCSVNTVRQEIEHPDLGHTGLATVANWLVDNGYTEGYATFWNCNNMIEMTSGKLDVWTLYGFGNDTSPDWLQVKDHLTTDPEHPFLLVDTEVDGPTEEQGLVQYGDCEKVYDDGRYVVYVFDSADAVHAASAAATAAAE